MEDQYDKAAILNMIRLRENRLSRNGSGMAVGLLMVRAAEQFVRSSTLSSLNAFASLEEAWRAGQPKARQRFTTMFQRSLGLAESAPKSLRCNTPHNKEWNPDQGYVYGFWSFDQPGLIKLGATTQRPEERLARFKKSYALHHLKVAFYFQVEKPRLVELDCTESLRSYRRSMTRRDSREWYGLAPSEAKVRVDHAITRAAVKRLGVPYVAKDIDLWKEIDFWPQGPRPSNGCIVSRN